MKRGKPAPPAALGEALKEFLKTSGLDERVSQASVIPNWKKLVGPQIAAVTEPLLVNSAGTLLVGVQSSAWMSELSLMEPQLLRAINKNRSSGSIKKIRFRLMR
jgi:predicted nucleic acid-binding Zn ribbon protein